MIEHVCEFRRALQSRQPPAARHSPISNPEKRRLIRGRGAPRWFPGGIGPRICPARHPKSRTPLSSHWYGERLDLTAADAKPERFLSSRRYEGSLSYSPDEKRIAFTSNRGGVRQIWVAGADGGNTLPLTSFSAGLAGSPKWPPDGQFIVFDARPEGNADIHTVPSGGGPVKRLTSYAGEDHVPFGGGTTGSISSRSAGCLRGFPTWFR